MTFDHDHAWHIRDGGGRWVRQCSACGEVADLEPGEAEEYGNGIVFVTAYDVTRHYGGPEEGGWWYDWNDPIRTVPCSRSDSEAIREALREEYADRAYGDRFSVLGGASLEVYVEDSPAESATISRPHYE